MEEFHQGATHKKICKNFEILNCDTDQRKEHFSQIRIFPHTHEESPRLQENLHEALEDPKSSLNLCSVEKSSSDVKRSPDESLGAKCGSKIKHVQLSSFLMNWHTLHHTFYCYFHDSIILHKYTFEKKYTLL